MSGWSFARAPFVIAGPCVVEPGDLLPRVAEVLARFAERRRVPVCFKASFDKANRARPDAPRGPGLEEGLRALERVRSASGLPVLTDIHEPAQAAPAAQVADAYGSGTVDMENVDIEGLRAGVEVEPAPAGPPAGAAPAPPEVGSSTELLELRLGKAADAPLCMTCGTKMRPAGSCYLCEGCGSTSGCS